MTIRSNITLVLLLAAVSCDPFDDKLVITNQSDHKLYYTITPYAELSTLYQKTLSEQGIQINYQNVVKEIEPNTSKNEMHMGHRGKAWKNYIKNTCENGKLRIFTFSIDTLKRYDFKNIIDHKRFLLKREFTINDLEKINWEVKLP